MTYLFTRFEPEYIRYTNNDKIRKLAVSNLLDFYNLLGYYKEKDKNIQQKEAEIHKFIIVYNKYSRYKIMPNSREILDNYMNKKALTGAVWSNKNLIKNQIEIITKEQYHSQLENPILIRLFIPFSLSVFFFVFQRVKKLDFLLSILIGTAYTVLVVFVSGFLQYYVDVEPHDCSLDYSEDEIALFIFVSSALILHIFLSRVRKNKIYQYHIYASLITILCSFFSYISLFFCIRGAIFYSIIRFTMEDIYGGSEVCPESDFILFKLPFLIASLLYFLFFVPFYHRLFTRLRSLPK